MAEAERTTLVKSEPFAYSFTDRVVSKENTPSIKPDPFVIEIPDVTPPPEPTPSEKRLTFLVTQAILSSTLEGTGTFLLVRVPRVTSLYRLGLIRSDGVVLEPQNTLGFDGDLQKLTTVNKDIVKIESSSGPAFFLTTEDNWTCWELIGKSSSGHRHFHMSTYASQDLNNGLNVRPLLKDDFIIQSKDGIGLTLNLSHINTRSPEFHRHLFFFSAGAHFLSMNYSSTAIRALVEHFYDNGFLPIKFATAVELLKMVRDLRIRDNQIIWLIDAEITKYPLNLQGAVHVWKISNRLSQPTCNHCLKHFRANLYSLKTPQEFYELFQSQQFTIDDIKDFMIGLMDTRKWK